MKNKKSIKYYIHLIIFTAKSMPLILSDISLTNIQ